MKMNCKLRITSGTAALIIGSAFLLSGCGKADTETPPIATSPAAESNHHEMSEATSDVDAAEIKASLDKLSEEDRALAVAQGYCALSGEPLGSMGAPLKLIVSDEPVFVCCKGCEKAAAANPDRTLAKVAEFKAKVKAQATPKDE